MINIQLSKGLKIDIKENPCLPEGWIALVPEEYGKSCYLYNINEDKFCKIGPFDLIPFIEPEKKGNEYIVPKTTI